ncbi:SGNH/GDSL hydrolase family protein [Halieaceae bacterium IMCC8485]|uniref:SGNH/GDSL hydrolase family protein n=1 Tax=Candidatus Seongchinamella marina TaxID=2518990 RepID=A0ABT3SQ26_9GAMM|nr:SGNH/GDSL hydrolase family protein [Candidatus Seongchinamella marina]MCX2972085.1 SGNH/GDSL hydrolase family protein [Candidatus Seongchinamella marina]
MFRLFILMLLLSAPAHSASYWLFGDSLSSDAGAWSSKVGFHINNVAQAGSMITQSDIPRQVSCAKREVIYWLGTNEAGDGVSEGLYKLALRDHMQFLSGRDCDVWLVLPVLVTLSPELEQRTKDARQWSKAVAKEYDNVTVLSAPYLTADTIDGLHPTDNRHGIIARWITKKLAVG